jgi:hypothetical protein
VCVTFSALPYSLMVSADATILGSSGPYEIAVGIFETRVNSLRCALLVSIID